MLSPNTVLQDRYRIERILGQGGMGAVYEAVDQKFGSTVALKQTLMTGEALDRAFEREARLLNKLRHAALPVVIDYFLENDGKFLVMQYIPGEDLAALLATRGGPFAVADVLNWADHLLDALDYLHAQDPPVIHRDIKPQNVKMTPRGEVILLDFGLAKGTVTDGTHASATASIMAYTAHYAPLEQMRGAGTDARSDLYSLGATLYTLLTAQVPADALTRAEVILSSRKDPLARADALNPFVPASVAGALERAMAMDRNERFASAAEMRDALREAARASGAAEGGTLVASSPRPAGSSPLEAETVAAGAASQPRLAETAGAARTTTPRTEPGTRRSVLWPALALLAVLAIAAAAVLPSLLGRRTEPPQPAPAPPPAPAYETIQTAPALTTFAFETASLSPTGAVTGRRQMTAGNFPVDLGGGAAIEVVRIPGGSYERGSPPDEAGRFTDESPVMTVTVPEFYLSRYEVTRAQWRAVAAMAKVEIDLPADPAGPGDDQLPVDNVTWAQATEFCARLSRHARRPFRLPSESEWEYACRAGTATPFAFGPTLSPEVANYDSSVAYGKGPARPGRGAPVAVGRLGLANAFGLSDMHGSVWEWCLGVYHDTWEGGPTDGSAWTTGGDARVRVCRGGAWNSLAADCRSASRNAVGVYDSPASVGLRVAMGGPQ